MGAYPRYSQTDAGFGSSVTAQLDTQVATGDIQYVMVASDSTTAHVWPAGWSVLYNAAAGPGRVSVAKRTRVGGDTNPTITGGTSGHFTSAALALKRSGSSTASGAVETAQANASSTSILTASLASGDAHPTGIYMIAFTVGHNLVGQYPAINPTVDGGANSNAPPIVYLPYGAATIPALTFTQDFASPSVVFCIAAVTSPDEIGYDTNTDFQGEFVRWTGYNKYPLKQNSAGGSISVL